MTFQQHIIEWGGSAGETWNKTTKHITQPKQWSEFCQVGIVFESAYLVDCERRDLEAPKANNMAEVVDAVGEQFAFVQTKRHIRSV